MSAIAGLGVDLVEIRRIRRIIDRYGDRFIKRSFSDNEREASKRLNDPAPFFAARFAAKEAFSKAVGTGFTGFGPVDIMVVRDKSGPPRFRFSRKLQNLFPTANEKDFALSISHEKETAIAMVIWHRDD